MDRTVLRKRLEKCVEGLDEMINGILMEAVANELDPYQMKDARDIPVLAPLLVTQTSALLMLSAMPEGD